MIDPSVEVIYVPCNSIRDEAAVSTKRFLFTSVVLFSGAGIGFVSSAHAGEPGPARLTVLKQVNGTFPEGTIFTVHVTCNLDTENDVDADVTFDATGAPTSANVFNLDDYDGQCFVEETGTGGAALVTYTCEDNHVALGGDENDAACEDVQEGKFSVDFDNLAEPGAVATVTVHNTASTGAVTPTTVRSTSPLPSTGADRGGLVLIAAAFTLFGLLLAGGFGRRRPNGVPEAR